jgi:hypothetical protein
MLCRLVPLTVGGDAARLPCMQTLRRKGEPLRLFTATNSVRAEAWRADTKKAPSARSPLMDTSLHTCTSGVPAHV